MVKIIVKTLYVYSEKTILNIPRGKERLKLAKYGMIGKLILNECMPQEEVFADIKAIYKDPLKLDEDKAFNFTILRYENFFIM